MSIRKLFDKRIPQSVVSSTDLEKLGKSVESSGNIKQKIIEKNRFIPQKDYSRPETFAHFGSAVKYYSDSFDRIVNQYPYDGSLREQTEFFNNSTYLDLYIYDNVYPRTTGYATISPNGWGSVDSSVTSGSITIGLPDIVEYIQIVGGPHTASSGMIGKDLSNTFENSNFYDPDKNRESNLKFDFNQGVTIETWIKKEALIPTASSDVEYLFHLTNDETGTDTSGSLQIFFLTSNSGASDTPLVASFTSGTVSDIYIYSGITTSELIDNNWHHVAISFQNSGSDAVSKAYLDGQLKDTTISAGNAIGEVTGSLIANLGATRPFSYDGFIGVPEGSAKLSGSIDEFRYWKTARTSEEIGRYWFTQYGGGTNNDEANTDLGVYLKFNEGITGIAATDSIALDYSGRISNGTWVGYSAEARSTSSAIDLYLGKESEFKDPIIYSFHPDVVSTRTSLESSGSTYDLTNNASFYYTMPTWIIEEDDESGQELLKLSQVLSSYLDTLYLQIENYPKLKDVTYPGATTKPLPFSYKLLEGFGLSTSEIFVDSTILEQISNRDETKKFDLDLTDIKNLIYKNIYNNLVYIYKSKGNMKAFRNLMRCYGIDTDLVKINLYGDNATYQFRDNYEVNSTRKKYVDFNETARFGGSVYQHTASSPGSDARSFISASGGGGGEGNTSFTLEAEAIFPKKLTQSHPEYFPTNFITSSLFGFHTALTSSPGDYTWPASDWNMQVYSIREEIESDNVHFQMNYSSSAGTGQLTSSLFYDVYDNQKWNFAVRFSPSVYGLDLVSGSSSPPRILELYGVNSDAGIVANEFLLTASLPVSYTSRLGFINQPKRIYAGAHRTNFTGSLLEETDVKLGSVRYWTSYLNDQAIQAHSRDPENHGVIHPYESTYLYSTPLSGVLIPEMETLALNWEFDTLTGSDASGEFFVPDLSSGSTERQSRYRWMGEVVGTQHPGKADFFPADSSKVLDTRFVYSGKQTIPENIQSADMINIDETDDVYQLVNRPIEYFFAIEKSMYQNISEEILNVFATIVDFNTLIGDPVNRYRQEYKQLSKLRQLFFERVQNEPDLDRYIEFYKWIDNSLSNFLNQLIPASAKFSDSMRNMVESHVLERNKYWTKFPTLETRIPDLENNEGCQKFDDAGNCLETWEADKTGMSGKGFNQLDLDSNDNSGLRKGGQEIFQPGKWKSLPQEFAQSYENNRHPVNDDPEFNRAWWARFADSATPAISSGNPEVDANRNIYRRQSQRGLSGGHRTVETLRMMLDKPIDGGVNSYINKDNDYLKNTLPHVRPITGDTDGIYLTTANIESYAPNTSDNPLIKRKLKYSAFKAEGSLTTFSDSFDYQSVKGERIVPFTILTTTTVNKYALKISADLGHNVDMTKIHVDTVDSLVPLQGPFTEKFVGGMQVRHTDLNQTGADTATNRAEAWQITSSTGVVKILAQPFNLPRATLYRAPMAKRPINIQNIKQVVGQPTGYVSGTLHSNIGNFRKDYEIVQAPGRTSNNRAWTRQGPWSLLNDPSDTTLSASAFVGGMFDAAKIQRGRTEHVMVSRFSAPGDPSTMGDSNGGPGLDRYAAEFSPNNQLNWRNSMVRGPLRDFMLTPSVNQFGYYSGVPEFGIPGSTVNAQNYSGTGSFYQVNRNSRMVMQELADGSIVTGTQRDNYWVQHPIPATDLRYAWITASLESITPAGFGYWPKDFYVPSAVSASIPPVTFAIVGSSAKTAIGFVDFVGMNQLVYEPIQEQYTSARCFYPLQKSAVPKINQADKTEASNFDYGDILSYEAIPTPATGGGAGKGPFDGNRLPDLLNVLNLHRNGPYQYPSWKQLRSGETSTSRYLRKNNFIGCVEDRLVNFSYETFPRTVAGTSTTLYCEPAVQARSLPLGAMFGVKAFGSSDIDSENVINLEVSLINAYSFANSQLKACASALNHLRPVLLPHMIAKTALGQYNLDPNGDVKYEEADLFEDTGYGPLSDMIHNMDSTSSPVESLVELVYSAPIYPAPKNKFSSMNRKRNEYSNTFWRTDRSARTLQGAKKFIDFSTLTTAVFVPGGLPPGTGPYGFNSMGIQAFEPNPAAYSVQQPVVVQSAWAMDANDDFETGPIYVSNDLDFSVTVVGPGSGTLGGSTLGHPGELQNNYSQCFSSAPLFSSSYALSCSYQGPSSYPGTIAPLLFGAVLYNELLDSGTYENKGFNARQFGEYAVGNGSPTSGVPNAYTLSAWVRPKAPASSPAGLSNSRKAHIISFASSDHTRPVTPTPGTCSVRLFLTGANPSSADLYVGTETVISTSAGFHVDTATSSISLDVGSSWYHILCCYDATTPGEDASTDDRIKLYINGALVSLGAITTTPTTQPYYGTLNASTGAIGHDVSYNTDIATLTGSTTGASTNSYFINNVFEGDITEVSFFNYSIHSYNPSLVEKMYNDGCPPNMSFIPTFDDYTLRPIGWYRMGSEPANPATSFAAWMGPANAGRPPTNGGSASWDPDTTVTTPTVARLINAVGIYWPADLRVYPVGTPANYRNPFYSRGDGYPVLDISLSPGTANVNMIFSASGITPSGDNAGGWTPCPFGYLPPDKNYLIAAPLYSRKHTLQSAFSVGQFGWAPPKAVYPSTADYSDRTITTPLPQTSGAFADWVASVTPQPPCGAGSCLTGTFQPYPLGKVATCGGQALWEAGTQAGYIKNGAWVSSPSQPFYDSYSDFNINLRLKNQHKSILPEFRMSDQIDFYLNKQNGDFLAKNDNWLSIPGATGTIVDSTQDGFFEIYSHTDFLKNFSLIKKDLEGDVINPTTITLKCRALKKFLPYDGFFPAERGLQLASLFSQSYGKNIAYSGLDSSLTNARFRPFLTQFFSPGIFFNMEKSCMAVDHPGMSSEPQVINYVTYQASGSALQRSYSNMFALGTQKTYSTPHSTFYSASWDFRLPFESLVEPEKYAAKIDIYDLEPSPSSSLDVVANWNGEGDKLYSRAMSNYLAAHTEFFMPRGEYSRLESVPEGNFLTVASGTSYGMRLKVYRTTNKPRQWLDYSALGNVIPWGDVPQDPRILMGEMQDFRETFTWAPTNPSAWFPPVAGTTYLGYRASNVGENATLDDIPFVAAYNTDAFASDCLTGHNECGQPAPHGGEGWWDFVFKAKTSGKITIDEIFSQGVSNYWRIDPLENDLLTGPTGTFSGSTYGTPRQQAIWSTNENTAFQDFSTPMSARYANAYAMQVDATFNLLGKEGDKWVIQPKHEKPMFNYNTNSVGYAAPTLPLIGSASTPIGGWPNFGSIEADRGVYYEIDAIPQGWREVRGAVSSSTFNMEKLSGIDMTVYKNPKFEDLSKLVGFSSPLGTNKTRMGNLAESLTVSEAVVAVPFVVRNGERQYFEIPSDTIRKALGELNSISSDKAVSMASYTARAALEGLDKISGEFFDNEADVKQARARAAAMAAAEGAAAGAMADEKTASTVPQTIKDMVNKMKKYVFPPRMDFVTNLSAVTPFAMYIFEFDKTFDQNDLAYIAQNLYPPVKDVSFSEAEASISHKLFSNELMGSFGNGEDEQIEDCLQWMVFKVKQRANNNYFSKIAKETGKKTDQLQYSYNWPYDFFSLVEFADIDAKIGFGKGLEDDGVNQKVAEIKEDPLIVATSKKKKSKKGRNKK